MERYIKIFGAFCILLLVSSCSPTLSPFTENIYREFDNEKELSKIQFYLSNDIVLYRDYGKTNSRIEKGKVRIVNGRKIEEIIFEKGTPGVFLFSPKRNKIAVSFEPGDEKYLMFGPNEKMSGRFVLLAKEWKRSVGKVTYGGEVWNTRDESAFTNLMIDLEKARKTQVRKKTVKGRRV